jgi:hypothetical protein
MLNDDFTSIMVGIFYLLYFIKLYAHPYQKINLNLWQPLENIKPIQVGCFIHT